MKDTASMRTQLTKNRLKESAIVLQSIINACNTCAEGKVSWSQACRTQNLDPLKTRMMILNLDKCANFNLLLEDAEIDIYDGYEDFYRCIFGDRMLEQVIIPFDYKESVLHVVRNTGLDDNESLVLMRRFGLGEYEVSDTLEAIGKDLNVSRDHVRHIEATALRRCRYKQRLNILKMGFTKYSLLYRQAEELNDKQLEQARMEHEALMMKYDAEHKEHMEIIASNSYEDALMKILHEHLPEILTGTHIDVLQLNTRPYNALIRGGINNLFSLLKLNGMDELTKLRTMGRCSAEEVIEKLDDYIRDNYSMTADKLRSICFSQKRHI